MTNGRPPSDLVRFIVLCGPRTGSTMLTTALNSHPAIVCFNEIFNFTLPAIDFAVEGYDGRDPDVIALRKEDPATFMENHVFSGHPPHIQAAGFKFMYDHFWEFDGLIEALQAMPGLRVIHLTRRNQVRAFLSFKIASSTGAWRRTRPRPLATRIGATLAHPERILPSLRRRLGSASDTTSVALSPSECIEYIETRLEQEAHFERLFADHERLPMQYEDMLDDRQSQFARAQAFLGVASRDLRESVERQNPGKMRELIANYGELADALASTPYAWMLKE